MEPIIKLLRGKYAIYHSVAATALGTLGDRLAVQPLISALNSQDETVRSRAVLSLGEIGDTAAVDAIIRVLRNETVDKIRMHAARVLGNLGGSKAVAALRSASSDEHEDVRWASSEALQAIQTDQRIDLSKAARPPSSTKSGWATYSTEGLWAFLAGSEESPHIARRGTVALREHCEEMISRANPLLLEFLRSDFADPEVNWEQIKDAFLTGKDPSGEDLPTSSTPLS